MDASGRILDASFNRAREALRVLEDYARFGLEDANLSGAVKSLRHALAHAAREASLTDVFADRDIVGDVGRTIAGAGEYSRASLGDVVVAAAKRLTEALRVIEEVGKIRDAAFGAAVERIRYAAYDLEQRIVVRLAPRGVFADVRLYVLITEASCAGDWRRTAEAALRGGAQALQLREKDLPDRALLERAKELARICHDHRAICIVNDRPDIAALAGADGAHVGQDDLPVRDARRVVGAERIIGVSTHTLEQAREALTASPDYVAVGPMFDTPAKPRMEAVEPELWSAVRRETSLPLVAIGGINADNIAALVERGCDRVCVCRAVIGAADVEAAARGLADTLHRRTAAPSGTGD